MATGVATSQGWSPQMVSGIDRVPVQGDSFLFNQMSLTSTTGNFSGENRLPKFGRKHSLLAKVNSDIRYLQKV
jgi:hypothetical protein